MDIFNAWPTDDSSFTLDQLAVPSLDSSPATGESLFGLLEDMDSLDIKKRIHAASRDANLQHDLQFLSGSFTTDTITDIGIDSSEKGPLAQLLLSRNPQVTYSPNASRRKKVRHFDGRQSVDEDNEEEVVTSGTVRTANQNNASPSTKNLQVKETPIDPSFNFMGSSEDLQMLANQEMQSQYNFLNNNSPPYMGAQSPPQNNGNWYSQAAARRKQQVKTPTTIYPQQQITPSTPREPVIPALDANFAKVQLLEMGYPHTKKDPQAFCSQVVNFICEYSKILVGGFYIHNNNQALNATTAWILSCTHPSVNDFKQYFHYNVGERFIMQAAVEKRCFCVHSSSWQSNSTLLSFLFVPIPNETPGGNAIGVMVLGTVLHSEEELHGHLLFLDQIRKPIATILRSLLRVQHSLYQLQHQEYASLDVEQLKQDNVYERSIIGILSTLPFEEDTAVIGTNVKGLITYASVGAQKLLGYMPQEMIGRMMITQTVDTSDLLHRSHEIEAETGKVLPADFTVMSFKTIFTRGNEETRVWNMMRKDRTLAAVRLTARPLNDDGGVFGFVFYGKEIQEAAPTANSPVHEK